MTRYTVSIAGTTQHTVMCAEHLAQDERFEIVWVLTPPPQPIGRKQILTKNPLHLWAEAHNIPVILVEKKIRVELKEQLTPQPDFLLVVDFGYLVPTWLLELPKIAPLNIHPSLLPRWRGSSPGQFVLLHGEKTSAVTIMIMGEGLDTGPILWQGNVEVNQNWTQIEYYQHSFTVATTQLSQIMIALAEGTLHPTSQPEHSPTPIARRLQKQDGYISWEDLQSLIGKQSQDLQTEGPPTAELFHEVQYTTQHPLAQVIRDAVRAFQPWPGIWTVVPTKKGPKRMKLLNVDVLGERLELKEVQIEGQQPSTWKSISTLLSR
jgi:methionyl-tRNA formyltransferase